MTREQRYIEFFTQLSIENLHEFENYFTGDAHFKDPFNNVIGIESIRKVFEHMFATTESPRFTITHHAKNESILLINWLFEFEKKQKKWQIEGSSRVCFNENDLVSEHIDFWDPAEQIYVKVGILKPLMNFLTKRLSSCP